MNEATLIDALIFLVRAEERRAKKKAIALNSSSDDVRNYDEAREAVGALERERERRQAVRYG